MRKITGAVGLSGQVYRTGQEKELAMAAEKAGVDLSPHLGTSLEGDWGGDIKATPAATELAKEKGVDLSTVKGTGADGSIKKSDVEAAIE